MHCSGALHRGDVSALFGGVASRGRKCIVRGHGTAMA